jgi:hypothetical protein
MLYTLSNKNLFNAKQLFENYFMVEEAKMTRQGNPHFHS